MKTFKEFADEYLRMKVNSKNRKKSLMQLFNIYLYELENIMWDVDLLRYVPTNYHKETMGIFNMCLQMDLTMVLDTLAKQRGYGSFEKAKIVLNDWEIVFDESMSCFYSD